MRAQITCRFLLLVVIRRQNKALRISHSNCEKNTAFLGQINLSSRPLDRGEMEAQVVLKIDTLNGSSAVQLVKAIRTQCTV